MLCVCAPVRPLPALQCPDGAPPPCTRPAARAAAPAPTSVAVLYFDNLSRDTNDTYLAEGLTDELITRLGQIERIQVKSRNAVRRFRGSAAADPAAVGRALGVAHLVSGSVRRDGDRLRVTVELTRAATGAHVWGDVLERTDRDLMSVESQMASAIATAIGGRLAPAERRVLVARPSAVPAAYDHWLRGEFLLARRTLPDARRALAEYEAAVQVDPSFARAWARIGLTYVLSLDWGWPWPGLTVDSLLARGLEAADRAVALDSASAEAWTARGKVLVYRYPRTFEGAVLAHQRAVALDPRSAEAWHQYGSVLRVLRRDGDAINALQRALALDPQRMISLVNVGIVTTYAGRDVEALRWLDSAVAVNPESYYPYLSRGFVRLRLGDLAGAQTDADAAVRLRPAGFVLDTEPLLVALLAARGDSAGALVRARRLAQEAAGNGTAAAFNAATALAWVGDRSGALDVVEDPRIAGILLWFDLQDPVLTPLRGEPRYQRLLAELGPR